MSEEDVHAPLELGRAQRLSHVTEVNTKVFQFCGVSDRVILSTVCYVAHMTLCRLPVSIAYIYYGLLGIFSVFKINIYT